MISLIFLINWRGNGKLLIAVCLTVDITRSLFTILPDYTYSVIVNLCHIHFTDVDCVYDRWIELVHSCTYRRALILVLITQIIFTIHFLFELWPALQKICVLCWQSRSWISKILWLKVIRLLWDGWRASRTRIAISFMFFNPLTPELNPSAQRCLTRFVTRDFLLEPCISLIYAWKTNKYTNYSFSLLIAYVISYMFRHYISILRERS
jgi:hypothetical protein